MRRDVRRKTSTVRSPIAPVEMPGLGSHLCFALYAASNHMTRLFVPFLQKLGVTYPQYLVLVVLWERGAQGVGDLASLLRMDFGTLSPMLKRIEGKGLITRQRQATDERRVLVDLTPKGLSLRKRTEQMLGEFYCFLNMPLDELTDLKDRLHHFEVGRTERVAGTSPKNSEAGFLSLSLRRSTPIAARLEGTKVVCAGSHRQRRQADRRRRAGAHRDRACARQCDLQRLRRPRARAADYGGGGKGGDEGLKAAPNCDDPPGKFPGGFCATCIARTANGKIRLN